jgi:hypothetical protein
VTEDDHGLVETCSHVIYINKNKQTVVLMVISSQLYYHTHFGISVVKMIKTSCPSAKIRTLN